MASHHLQALQDRFTKFIFFFSNGDGYILDKWFAMSIQALNARYWTVDAAGRPKFIWLHRNFPMLTYGQTTTSNDVTAEEYGRYCQLLEELASLLKKGDGEAVESCVF